MSDDGQQVQDLLEGIRVAMVTTPGPDGLCSRPMTVQRVDADGVVWFLVDADADWVPSGEVEANAAFVDDDTWVSLAGTATLVTEEATVARLGDPVSGAWFQDGASPAALKVVTTHADWWTAPGRLRRVLNIAGGVLSGHRPDMGDRGSAEP
ncbi:pyridoxamine 5'-phosphate oxidase family protein [Iamia majanohamensis]|uniref:Pyridoxamine 5'-phosphate oxidase family protein n=1 Tax=Iamia majanohamensis TaxID=467976 RepID=A0AAE9Y765_9ACTN|nr:pyridoxamine 5'-phosphate oxidase family protein [Iamia majanohamensis]WCO68180.1 pyridoxamine 5'-phosphate oxidase family protein [Iamia majanohamensis]